MIHPNTEIRFISPEKGYGVVATKLIPKGTITWALDRLDRSFTAHEVDTMEPLFRRIIDIYTFRDCDGNYILCWDNARFVNHSFNSSCISTAYDFEIAVRDIHPGEELTDDYGYLNITEPFECVKEEGSDRTVVMPDDLQRYAPIWDEKLKHAFLNFNQVDQPLGVLVPSEFMEKARRIADGKEEMDSILACYYNPERQTS